MTGAEPAEPTDRVPATEPEGAEARDAAWAPVERVQPIEPDRVPLLEQPPTQPPQPAQPGPANPPVNYFGANLPPYQYTADPAQAGRSRKRVRRRVIWSVAAVVAAAAIATVGLVAIDSGRHGDSVVTAVPCSPAKLASCLLKPPSGAVQLTASPTWDAAVSPTLALYADNVITNAKGLDADTGSQLGSDGESAIAHTDWNAVDGDNIDLVLLEFDSGKGAQAWNSLRTAEIMAAYPGPTVSIPGDTTGRAYTATKVDGKGDIDAAYSTVVGDLVLDVAYSSPRRLAAPDLRDWAGTELASLRSAPKPADDAPDAAPQTEQVACADLRSCLPSTPDGMAAWPGSNNSDWVSDTDLSSQQYANMFWDTKQQPDILAEFHNDDVTGIKHTDWATNDASEQADVYLIQTLTEPGASSLYDLLSQEPQWESGLTAVAFSVPGVTAQAWHTTKADSDGLVESDVVIQTGNVIADEYLLFNGSWNSSLADKWITKTADRLTASEHTQNLGLPSLTAPKLAAPAPGSCPASGGCLLPLPSGATDTTSKSSYETGADVPATAYATAYDSSDSLEYSAWLTAHGFKSATHRSWTAASGATVDAVLLEFARPAQAHASVLAEYGLSVEGSRPCTDAAVRDALCLAEPVGAGDFHQMETVEVLGWKGDYEFRVNVTISNQADLAEAYGWLERQSAMLPAS